MRWAIVSIYLGESGKQGYYNSQEIGLARAMRKCGYECFIFFPCADHNVSREKAEDGITIVRVPARVIGVNVKYDWSILSEYNIDVAQINSDNRIFVYSAINYCDKHGILCYTYFGTLESDSRSTVKRLLMRCFMQRNIAAMKGHMNYAKNKKIAFRASRLGIKQLDVAPVGLDISVIPSEIDKLKLNRAEYAIPEDKKIILFVGRIDEYKHPMESLDIIKVLDQEYHLVVIGSGKLNDCFGEEIARRQLKERVSWIKQIPNTDIHRFYRAAVYMVNLNPEEIFGMSILEAMYQGCNVIAIHAPGPDEIIEDGVSGFLVNSMDEVPGIIMSGRHLSPEIVRSRVEDNFTWDKTAEKLDAWIQKEHRLLKKQDGEERTGEGTEKGTEKGTEHKPAILMLHNRYRQRGGEDTVVENEIQLLEQHGHRVFLYERDNSERFLPLSVFFSLRSYLDVKRIIKKHHIDIVHVHNTWMAMSQSVLYAAVRMRVPVVQTIHNFRLICPNAMLSRKGKVCEECINKGLQSSIQYGCYKESRLFTLVCALNSAIHKRTGIYKKINFICLTEFNRGKILQINHKRKMSIDPDKVFVKPNFIWERNCRCITQSDREGFLFAGRLTEEKGLKVLFKAWILMGDRAPRLTVYGNGELMDWCHRIIRKRGLNISIMGEVDRETLLEAYGKAKALIFPSTWYEGFPMTVIEALSEGTPVIASDMGNGKQYIEDGKNGLLFKCGSAKDLAQAVGRVAEKEVVLQTDDISLPEICTPEENYRVLKRIYDNVK